MAQTTFEEAIDEILTAFAPNIDGPNITRMQAIAEIKAAFSDVIPKKIKVSEFNSHMKVHIYGYNQAIKEITEKIK